MSDPTQNDDPQTSQTLQRQEQKPAHVNESTPIDTIEQEKGKELHPLLVKSLLHGGRLEPLSIIDYKVAQAATPDEAEAWLRVRDKAIEQEGELTDQNQRQSEENDKRFYRKALFWLQLLFSIATIAIGIYLIQSGTWLAGFFILGAGLYVFVADYVRMFFKEVWRG